tara:strand:+ start:1274 stop:1465 length:192 start_codon:yes stop_codon:yes gene_type:complete
MREHGLNQIKNNSHCVQHNTGSKLHLIRKAISELQIRKERKEIKKVHKNLSNSGKLRPVSIVD